MPDDQQISVSITGDVLGNMYVAGGDIIFNLVEHPRPDSGVPYLAPSLPANHVPRPAALAELRHLLLESDDGPAITAVRGMGGVGKTTLAAALCHEQQVIDAFPDGILWATVGQHPDDTVAQSAIAEELAKWGDALGHDLRDLPDAAARAAKLRTVLHDKRCLLVLDDVWDAAHLPSLLVGGPQCATVVTTRIRKVTQKLGVARELGVLTEDQAVTLLEEWANGGEVGTREEATELAKRLGYLPLALALAGAQAQDGETWADLLAIFREEQGADLSLLDLDDPDVRDESLELTFRLSLNRLSDPLPEQFAQLGVFAAGRRAPFDADAAAAVWEVSPAQARKSLRRLARAALLDRTRMPEVEGDFYKLHLLLRDYAGRLLDEETRQAAITRHGFYYEGILEQSAAEWQVAEVALPQIRTAWVRIPRDHTALLWHWVTQAEPFFYLRCLWSDLIAWWEATLKAAQAAGSREAEGLCEEHLGRACHDTGQPDRALDHYRRSLAIWQELGEQQAEAMMLGHIGMVYQSRSEFNQALDYYQRSLSLIQPIGDRGWEARMLHQIGMAYRMRGELARAVEFHKRSLEINRELGNRDGEASVLASLASLYEQSGDADRALDCYEQAAAIGKTLDSDAGDLTTADWTHEAQKASMLRSVGDVYAQHGELDRALDVYQQALASSEAIGDQRGVSIALRAIADSHRDRGDFEAALDYYQRSLEISVAVGDRESEGILLGAIGTTYRQLCDLDAALNYYRLSLTIQEELGDRHWMGNLHHSIGIMHYQRGEMATSLEHFEQALALRVELGQRSGEASTRNMLARIYFECEDCEQALEHAKHLEALYAELDDQEGETRALACLASSHYKLGNHQKALDYYERLQANCIAAGDKPGEAMALGARAMIHHERGDEVEAKRLGEHAIAIFEQIEGPDTERHRQAATRLRAKLSGKDEGSKAE